MSNIVKGVGIGYSPFLHNDTVSSLKEIDFIELTPEDISKRVPLEENMHLKDLKDKIVITLHGNDLSIASASHSLDLDLINHVKELAKYLNSPFYSDHLSYTREIDIDLELYMPPAFSEESAVEIIKNVSLVKKITELDFHLENVASLVNIPGIDFTEGSFITKICRETDSGVILNLDSIAISSNTYNIDPIDLINSYPLDCIESITIVPESCMNPMLKKYYGNNLDKTMWFLLEHVLNKSSAKSVLIQRRFEVNTFASLKEELFLAKSIYNKTKFQRSSL